ncbi:MAG: response regulator, partial [Syntrophales bacterium]|nr:response regulator [Syntrophales bacterium]
MGGWRRAAGRLREFLGPGPKTPQETLAAFVAKAKIGREAVVTLEKDLLEHRDLRALLVGCRNEISIGRRPGTFTYIFRKEEESVATQTFDDGFDFVGHTHPPDRYGVLMRFLPSDTDLYSSRGRRFFILSAVGVTWYMADESIVLDEEAYKEYVVSAETGHKTAQVIAQEMRERFDVEVEVVADRPAAADDLSSPAQAPAALRTIRITEETLEDIERYAAVTVNSATEMHGLIVAAGEVTKLFALPEKQLEADGRLNYIERYLWLRAMFADRLQAWIKDRGLDGAALVPVADIHTHSRRHYLRYTSAFGKPLEKEQEFPVSYAVSPSTHDLYYWGVLRKHNFGVCGLSLGVEDKDYFRKICADVLLREYGRKIEGIIPVAIAALIKGELVVGVYRPANGAGYDENKDQLFIELSNGTTIGHAGRAHDAGIIDYLGLEVSDGDGTVRTLTPDFVSHAVPFGEMTMSSAARNSAQDQNSQVNGTRWLLVKAKPGQDKKVAAMLKMRGFEILLPRDKGFFGYLYVKVLAHQRVDDVMFFNGVMNQASCVMSAGDVASVRADMARQRLDTGDFWESVSSPSRDRTATPGPAVFAGAQALLRELKERGTIEAFSLLLRVPVLVALTHDQVAGWFDALEQRGVLEKPYGLFSFDEHPDNWPYRGKLGINNWVSYLVRKGSVFSAWWIPPEIPASYPEDHFGRRVLDKTMLARLPSGLRAAVSIEFDYYSSIDERREDNEIAAMTHDIAEALKTRNIAALALVTAAADPGRGIHEYTPPDQEAFILARHLEEFRIVPAAPAQSSPARVRNKDAEARAREIQKIVFGGLENAATGETGRAPVGRGVKRVLAWGLGVPLALALSVTVLFFKAFMFIYCLPHECAHFIAGLLAGVPVKEIQIFEAKQSSAFAPVGPRAARFHKDLSVLPAFFRLILSPVEKYLTMDIKPMILAKTNGQRNWKVFIMTAAGPLTDILAGGGLFYAASRGSSKAAMAACVLLGLLFVRSGLYNLLSRKSTDNAKMRRAVSLMRAGQKFYSEPYSPGIHAPYRPLFRTAAPLAFRRSIKRDQPDVKTSVSSPVRTARKAGGSRPKVTAAECIRDLWEHRDKLAGRALQGRARGVMIVDGETVPWLRTTVSHEHTRKLLIALERCGLLYVVRENGPASLTAPVKYYLTSELINASREQIDAICRIPRLHEGPSRLSARRASRKTLNKISQQIRAILPLCVELEVAPGNIQKFLKIELSVESKASFAAAMTTFAAATDEFVTRVTRWLEGEDGDVIKKAVDTFEKKISCLEPSCGIDGQLPFELIINTRNHYLLNKTVALGGFIGWCLSDKESKRRLGAANIREALGALKGVAGLLHSLAGTDVILVNQWKDSPRMIAFDTIDIEMSLAYREKMSDGAVSSPATVGPRILVAEDRPDVMEILVYFLSEIEGSVVEKAEDGLAAMVTFAQQDVDILVTDLDMPGMDGYQLAKEIKRSKPGLLIVMQTDNDTVLHPRSGRDETRVADIGRYVDVITSKDPDRVVAAVSRLLESISSPAARKLTLGRLEHYYEDNITPLVRETGSGLFAPVYFADVKKLARHLPRQPYFKGISRAADLGSGDGRAVMGLAAQKCFERVTGYELDDELLDFSGRVHRDFGSADGIEFKKENFLDADFSGFDFYFYYAKTADPLLLGKKLAQEAPAGALVVIYQYQLDGLYAFLKENGFIVVDRMRIPYFSVVEGEVATSFVVLQKAAVVSAPDVPSGLSSPIRLATMGDIVSFASRHSYFQEAYYHQDNPSYPTGCGCFSYLVAEAMSGEMFDVSVRWSSARDHFHLSIPVSHPAGGPAEAIVDYTADQAVRGKVSPLIDLR